MRGGRAKSKDDDANGADDSTDQSPVYDSLFNSSVPTKTRGKREGEAHVSEASRDGKKKRVEAARSEDSSNVAGASHLNNSVESAKTRTNRGGSATLDAEGEDSDSNVSPTTGTEVQGQAEDAEELKRQAEEKRLMEILEELKGVSRARLIETMERVLEKTSDKSKSESQGIVDSEVAFDRSAKTRTAGANLSTAGGESHQLRDQVHSGLASSNDFTPSAKTRSGELGVDAFAPGATDQPISRTLFGNSHGVA